MNTLTLLFTSDIGDILTAATEAREWARFISMHEGYDVSSWHAFLALTCVAPWRKDFTSRYGNAAPWRVVRSELPG